MKVSGYAAQAADQPLAPFDFERREPRPDDVVIDMSVSALRKGMLVAWFEGGMEWGPRALGARSILASPFSPYVLENLNGFLKRRQSWRGYGLSVAKEAMGEHFDGPASAPFMESDYRVRDAARFKHALPAPGSTVRVHGVDRRSPPRFRRLLEAFGRKPAGSGERSIVALEPSGGR